MRSVHSSFFTGELKMKGLFHLHGPQPIGVDGGAPQWISDIMSNDNEIMQIAVIRKKGGVIYSRPKEN